MSERVLPRYPVYVPSKGRSDWPLTINALVRDGVPFNLVVEPGDEYAKYAKFGELPGVTLLTLPRTGGGLIYARNWIKDRASAEGHERHWQIDDNIRCAYRYYKQHRIPCEFGVALRVCEDFTDRYENVAISGLAYRFFVVPKSGKIPPFYLNNHVYSCSLVLCSLPHRWRSVYNDDTDMCLQVLADGWCTVLINAFMIDKVGTMIVKGGNTDALYRGDGRLRMARSLQRLWPGVVETKRRFRRPQHVVRDSWSGFDTPLKLKSGVDPDSFTTDEYGMRLRQVKPIKSRRLAEFVREVSEGGDTGGDGRE